MASDDEELDLNALRQAALKSCNIQSNNKVDNGKKEEIRCQIIKQPNCSIHINPHKVSINPIPHTLPQKNYTSFQKSHSYRNNDNRQYQKLRSGPKAKYRNHRNSNLVVLTEAEEPPRKQIVSDVVRPQDKWDVSSDPEKKNTKDTGDKFTRYEDNSSDIHSDDEHDEVDSRTSTPPMSDEEVDRLLADNGEGGDDSDIDEDISDLSNNDIKNVSSTSDDIKSTIDVKYDDNQLENKISSTTDNVTSLRKRTNSNTSTLSLHVPSDCDDLLNSDDNCSLKKNEKKPPTFIDKISRKGKFKNSPSFSDNDGRRKNDKNSYDVGCYRKKRKQSYRQFFSEDEDETIQSRIKSSIVSKSRSLTVSRKPVQARLGDKFTDSKIHAKI